MTATVATDNTERRARNRPGASATADLLFDTVYSAAIGGSTIALFFLVVDSISGQPLSTPSLIGAVLFMGAEPAAVTTGRLDMVAYFSIVHLLSFGVFGAAVSFLCRWTGLSSRSPAAVTIAVFLLLSAASLLGAAVTMPGLTTAIGLHWILLGNLLTAATIAAFLRWSHRDDETPTS